jgi:biopolymer transport protein ExbD
MNWKVRHEGSPQFVELTRQELIDGLLDGAWEPTDEVMGPDETEWVAIESHPLLAEAAADLEPPPPRTYDDETRLDMNALIDVTLVLLIFFILTTTVAALQKRLEAPTAEEGKVKVAVITKQQVETNMIHVKASMSGGAPVVMVEDKQVEPQRLIAEFKRFVRSTGKTELLLEYDNEVSQDLVVKIIDSAKGAGMNKVRTLVPAG